MVSTRSSATLVSRVDEGDSNRIIAVVTGANSGMGLGICRLLLRVLSLPPGQPLPESSPQLSALPPSLRHLYPPAGAKTQPGPPPTLTLILVCRKKQDAETTRSIVLREHKRELSQRKKRRQPVREGWDAGLRIVAEECDLASVGGPRGLLALTERLKASYPHITSLYLNAGLAAFTSLNWGRFIGQVIMDGYAYATSHPVFMNERVGWVTADGRGAVWSVNTLAPYILVRELMPLLRRSPKALPFSPRVVYTSSCTATLDHLVPEPLHDYQLLEYEQTYSPSKYMADLIFCELDREYGSGKDPASTAPASIEGHHDVGRNRDELQEEDGEPEGVEGQRQVRCLLADPGCVATNINREGFGGGLFQRFMWFLNWIAFYLARLFGSPWHPVYATEAARPMLYAALIDPLYLPSANTVPSPKFSVESTRWGKTKVNYGEVDCWEEAADIGQGLVQRCEVIRKEWRRKEGLE